MPPLAEDSRPMCGLGGDGLPLKQQEFLSAARCKLADAFNAWGPQARREFRGGTFVKDAGRIPAGMKISVTRACWQRHAGVCMAKDVAVYEPCLRSGAALA
eukprot:3524892-Pyramimonas_sp.AAC.1